MLGASSFILALMLYAGFVYSNAYYGYYHIDSFAIGFDSFELALRSLRLATFPVLIALALVVLLPRLPDLLATLGVPTGVIRRTRRVGHTVARAYLVLVAAGIVMMLLWRYVQPFRWAAPLLVAGGLILGQTDAALSFANGRSRRLPRAGVIIVAGLFLTWVVALAAGQLGRKDAQADAGQIVRRVAVVVFSTERLGLKGPTGHPSEDLGAGSHFRYRYSGLRLLVERDHRYYLLPQGWRRDLDATYVIEDDETVRIELLPGTQPRR